MANSDVPDSFNSGGSVNLVNYASPSNVADSVQIIQQRYQAGLLSLDLNSPTFDPTFANPYFSV